MMMRRNKKEFFFLKNFRAVHRLLVCIAVAMTVFIALMFSDVESLLNAIISWNSFSFSMSVISWISFFTTSSKQLGQRAKAQDESRSVTFIIVLICVVVSFFGALVLIQNTNEGLMGRTLHIVASVMSVVLSWILLHTIYTLRYAHLYYSESLNSSKIHPSGLDFPENKTPDYLDFAYFSFVIGMTFQVSDVRITSPMIRRFSLLHGLISFLFNTIIVALTINIMAGLIK